MSIARFTPQYQIVQPITPQLSEVVTLSGSSAEILSMLAEIRGALLDEAIEDVIYTVAEGELGRHGNLAYRLAFDVIKAEAIVNREREASRD